MASANCARTVTGTLKRDLKAVRGQAALQFRTTAGSYENVKNVTSNSAGNQCTTVKVDRDGCFRFTFAGNSTTAPGASAGDCVAVLPVPKDYAKCADLNPVYPHGSAVVALRTRVATSPPSPGVPPLRSVGQRR